MFTHWDACPPSVSFSFGLVLSPNTSIPPRAPQAAIPNCANASDSASLLVSRLNSAARAHTASSWTYWDREMITRTVCSPEEDCAGTRHTARFHPAGRALNVLANMLLRRLNVSHSSKYRMNTHR